MSDKKKHSIHTIQKMKADKEKLAWLTAYDYPTAQFAEAAGMDMLLVGALIEARSCERFAALAPKLPERLGKFYSGLLASEARHFEHYIAFAKSECGVGEAEIEQRLEELKAIEASLIVEPDDEFRFHSGVPTAA